MDKLKLYILKHLNALFQLEDIVTRRDEAAEVATRIVFYTDLLCANGLWEEFEEWKKKIDELMKPYCEVA